METSGWRGKRLFQSPMGSSHKKDKERDLHMLELHSRSKARLPASIAWSLSSVDKTVEYPKACDLVVSWPKLP